MSPSVPLFSRVLLRRGRWVATALCLLVALSACGSGGRRFSVDSVPNIRRGSWTQQDVRRQFGQPQGVSVRGSGREVWRYQFEESQTLDTGTLSRIGRFVAALFGRGIPGSPINARSTTRTTYRLNVEFNREGVVQDYEYTRDSRPTREVY